MNTYTPNELRALADNRKKNTFYFDVSAAALHYAANVMEAAQEVIDAQPAMCSKLRDKRTRRADMSMART